MKNLHHKAATDNALTWVLTGYSSMIAVCFLLFGFNSSALVDKANATSAAPTDEIAFCAQQQHNSASSPLELPNSNEPKPEDTDLKEVKEKLKAKKSFRPFDAAVAEYFKYSEIKHSFLYYGLIIKNRQTVSLYVLYHSWKIFPC